MRNTILLFTQAEVGDDYNSIWMDQLGTAFQEIGYNIIKADLDTANVSDPINKALEQGCKFALGFQSKGIGITFDGEKSIYDELQIPYVNILIDTPYNPNSSDIAHMVRNQLVLCMDESHVNYLKVCYNHFKAVMCMPLAGTKIYNSLQQEDKSIPVLFVGVNYDFPFRSWHGRFPPEIAYVMDDVTDYVMDSDNVSIVDALEFILKEDGIELCAEKKRQLYPLIHWIYCFVRTKRRRSLIKMLADAGICIDVVGEGWGTENFAKRLKLHGKKTYREVLSLVSRSQILLNENGNFCNGAHERVFTGMMNGAAVLTDTSTYYDRHFSCRNDYITYSWRQLETVPYKLLYLLHNENGRNRIAQAGWRKALIGHTWAARARAIVDAVNQIWGCGDNGVQV